MKWNAIALWLDGGRLLRYRCQRVSSEWIHHQIKMSHDLWQLILFARRRSANKFTLSVLIRSLLFSAQRRMGGGVKVNSPMRICCVIQLLCVCVCECSKLTCREAGECDLMLFIVFLAKIVFSMRQRKRASRDAHYFDAEKWTKFLTHRYVVCSIPTLLSMHITLTSSRTCFATKFLVHLI